MSKPVLFFASLCILAISWAQNAKAESSAACVTHLTQDAKTTECSQALQRASRKTIGKFCRGESLGGDERLVKLKTDKINEFIAQCGCVDVAQICSKYQ
jgi:hypothetical protein